MTGMGPGCPWGLKKGESGMGGRSPGRGNANTPSPPPGPPIPLPSTSPCPSPPLHPLQRSLAWSHSLGVSLLAYRGCPGAFPGPGQAFAGRPGREGGWKRPEKGLAVKGGRCGSAPCSGSCGTPPPLQHPLPLQPPVYLKTALPLLQPLCQQCQQRQLRPREGMGTENWCPKKG